VWESLVAQSGSTVGAACADSPEPTVEFDARPGVPVIFGAEEYRELKDPSVTFDGSRWHLYGTGWMNDSSAAVVFHATSQSPSGPYRMRRPVVLEGALGRGVAAPGVLVDEGVLHLFIQTEFQELGGTIEHFVSNDGDTFEPAGTALFADPRLGEACIYDAQPAGVDGRRYLAYASAERVGQTQLHLARAADWSGPWERLGPIVERSDVVFQTQAGCLGYEWGLEGPQLVELPSGQVMLIGVCFLPGRDSGRRQRVFVATAPSVTGPYEVLGTPFDPALDTWAAGENGHATAVVAGDHVVVIYQRRQGAGQPWWLGTSTIPLHALAR